MTIKDEKNTVGNENVGIDEKKDGKTSAFWQKASQLGKKAADGIQKGAKVVADKTKEELYAQKMRKYNPLFAKEYKSKGFSVPDVIIIEDDKVIQGIDVCEGAVGWREMSDGVKYCTYLMNGLKIRVLNLFRLQCAMRFFALIFLIDEDT